MSTKINFVYEQGEKLLFELMNGQKFKAIYYCTDTYSVKLNNVTEIKTNSCYPGIQCFFKTEFYSIEKEFDTAVSEETEIPLNEKHETGNVKKQDFCAELCGKPIYINSVNNDFEECIKFINNSDTIVVQGLDSTYGRKIGLKLLVIATKTKTFVIDVKMCAAVFPAGIKDILESDTILKIVYNSMKLVDCLAHQHHTKLIFFYDIQVADQLVILKDLEKRMRKLKTCLQAYLNVADENYKETNNLNYMALLTRPVIDSRITRVARTAAYLMVLKNIIHCRLLKEWYEVNKYALNRTICNSPISSHLTTSQCVFEELNQKRNLKFC